jgi:hypothetical protein
LLVSKKRYTFPMSTITAVFEPESDGTVHLPIPEELRGRRLLITATLEAAAASSVGPERDQLQLRRDAFEKLRQLNPFREIDDPVAWQKSIRTDRALPERE